ncbi:MFS transporter [Sphaerisporangium dianthi]|uniref:MFS transporter n=1 Tax=Sphaerisporangium dianthi TaxID=1436120 RepID=A0ABV9CSP1_9ACTN
MNRRVIAMIVLIFAQFMDLVDSTIINTAIPSIQKDLNATSSQLEWMIGGYMLAFATLLITGGRLGDIVGRRRIFILGIAGFTLASLAASLASTGDVLIAARVAQGVFAGIMVPQVLSNVQVLFKPEERGPIYGAIGVITALGAIVGLLLGGWLITSDAFGAGWRSVFLVNIPVGVVLIVAALIFVPESKSEHPLKLDLLGMALAASSVFLLTYGLVNGRHAGWATYIWVMMAASPVLASVFVWQQKKKMIRDGSPLLPMHLFGNQGFRAGLVIQVLAWVATGSYMLIVGYYLQIGLGFTALETGLTMLAGTIGAIVATPMIAPLTNKYGKTLIFIGGLIQAVSFLWVMLLVGAQGADLSGWHLVPPLLVYGVGMVFLFPPLHDVTLATIPTKDAGAASGTFTTFHQVGFVLGIAVVGVIFFGIAGDKPTQATLQEGVTQGLWVTVIGFVIAGLVSLTMPKAQPITLPQGGVPAQAGAVNRHM